ncbi:MAG: hypothetical protein ACRBK7_30980 [Acidimicrobiales bacterium]
MADKSGPTFIEQNLTIHAELSARGLTDEERLDPLAPAGRLKTSRNYRSFTSHN